MEAEKAELKSILRGLLISSPRQMTVRDLQNDFARQEGREFPYEKFGFRNFIDYLRTIKDTVVLNGSQPIYVSPVVKANTAHVNDMVLRQKNSAPKKSSLKVLDKSRRRGWVPIVIPPDPPKALPTLLNIKIPSRTKISSDNFPSRPIKLPSSSFKQPVNPQTDTEHQMVNGLESSHNEEANKSVSAKQEYISEKCKEDTKCCSINGPYASPTNVNLSDEPTAWNDFSEGNNNEMEGHDDTLFQKYCFQNIQFRSINNIDEWYQTRTTQSIKPNSSLPEAEAKSVGNKTEISSATSVTETDTVKVDVTSKLGNCDNSKLKEEKHSEFNCEKNYFSDQRQGSYSKIGNEKENSTSDPILHCDKNCTDSLEESVHNRLLSDKTVLNMKKLMKDNPQGLWASEFPAIYKESYGVSLDYRLAGYMSMAAVAAAYPDVFICLRRSSADFLLLDADKPLPKHYAHSVNASSYAVVTEALKNNIEHLVATFPTGIPTENFKQMYQRYFTEDLNEMELGFSNLDELLQNLHEEFVIRLRQVGKDVLIYPAKKSDSSPLEPPLSSFRIDDTCEKSSSHPPEVFYSDDNIPAMTLAARTDGVPVQVSDVVSPTEFHLILYEFTEQLEDMMDEIQAFYSTTGEQFRMPKSAIYKGVKCVARYKHADWHRAEIFSINLEQNIVKVKYIDYGTVDAVSCDELRYMHNDFAKYPVHAIPAKLTNVEPKNGLQWDKEVCNFLLELVANKLLMAIKDKVNEGLPVSVGLVDTSAEEDLHVNDLLVAKGYAKFIHPPDIPGISSHEAKEEKKQSISLHCNGFITSQWTQDKNSYQVQKSTEADHFNLLHSQLLPEPDSWSPPSDNKKHDAVNVISDLEPSVKSFFQSSAKSNNLNILDENSTSDNFSSNAERDIPTLYNQTTDLISKANITKVWGTPFVMPSPLTTSTGLSNETDTSIKLKQIPDTWNVSTKNSQPMNNSQLNRTVFSESDNCTSGIVLNGQLQNSLLPDSKGVSQYSKLSLSNNSVLPTKHISTNHLQLPLSNTGFPRSCSSTIGVQSQTCIPNVWNLGNISVNTSWPPPLNNPAIYNPSTPMWQQSIWYQPQQSMSQFPINSFAAVTAVPPPGFSSLQNPFVTYSTSPFPNLNAQVPLINDPFAFQQRNKLVPTTVRGVSSNSDCRSLSPSTGLFANQLAPELPSITEISNEHSTILKKFGIEHKVEKEEMDINIQNRNSSVALHHEKNLSMQEMNRNQDTKNSVPISKQSVKSKILGNITIADSITDKKCNTVISADSKKMLVNQDYFPDATILTRMSSESVQNKEQDIELSEPSHCENNANSSFETVKSGDIVDRGHNQMINTSDSSIQKTNCNISVKACDTTFHDSNKSLYQDINKIQSEENRETKNLVMNYEYEISKKLEKLEIQSEKASSELIANCVQVESSENVKLNSDSSCFENSNEAKSQENCFVLSQGDTNVTSQKDNNDSEGHKKPLRCIRKTVLAGKVLTLINYNGEPYFCTDEFVRSFSKYSGRHVLLKIVDTHGMVLPFLEVHRSDNWEMFEMLDNCELNTMSRKPNGQIHDVLHMVPLSATTAVLKVLKISDAAIYGAIDNEKRNFDPKDDYWFES